MDQVLKARKMSSASARRKRIQARQEEEAQSQERYTDHKRRILLYDHLADQESESSDSESNGDSQNSQHEVEESVTTLSESSVVTPNDTPSAFPRSNMGALDASALLLKPQLHLVLPDTPVGIAKPSVHQPSPAPKLHASLVALSDFTYDRFSMILDSPVPVASPAQSVSTPDLEFDDYSPSPVEIATPISITLPKTRPSVIQISGRSSKKRRTLTVQSPLVQEATVSDSENIPPPPPPRSSRRLSQSSTRSGFLASEANAIQVPDLPVNASSMIANASRESVAISPNVESKKAIQRKSSQPLLSAIKTSHARMSSIKSLIKTPTHNTSSSISSSRPESRSSRPPTSAADVMNDDFQAFETVPANLYDLPALRTRPLTSHIPSRPSTSSSTSRQPSVTALPTVVNTPENDSTQNSEDADSQRSSMRQKKSFSSLRKRSESISHAIKSVTAKSRSNAGHTPKLSQQLSHSQHDVPLPLPLPRTPALKTPLIKPSVELSSFPSPPIPSSSVSTRSRKSFASYSMFPPSPQVGANRKSGVGLGLGLKV